MDTSVYLYRYMRVYLYSDQGERGTGGWELSINSAVPLLSPILLFLFLLERRRMAEFIEN